MQVLGITLKSLVFAFNKVNLIIDKEFIQAILISGRWLKKTQSSNWVLKLNLHKILFYSILALNLHSKEISLQSFFYLSSLFVFQMKKDQKFLEVLPWNLHQGSAMNPLQSLQHLKTPTCILKHPKTQPLFKKGH